MRLNERLSSRTPQALLPLVQQPAVDSFLDWMFFIVGGASAVWLAALLFGESFALGWGQIWFFLVFWVLLAYLVLPRLHRILTRIYVPEYFIGRARTSDGLLGDPINLALLGSEPQVHDAMTAAGWTRADDLGLATGWRIVASTLMRRSYLEAPVSPLLLFGRKQDFAYQQEVNGTPGKRHHVRFWRCPPDWLLPGGIRVDWLAAGTYDRAVGFSLFTLQVTHKIDARTDVERDHIVDTVTAATRRARVNVIRDFSTGYHARNGGGDAIVTDGDLPIIDISRVRTVGTEMVPTDSRDKRPSPTIVGALLVFSRALVTLVAAAAVFVDRDALDIAPGSDPQAVEVVRWVIVGALLLFAAADILLAWFVFLGRNWARVLVMTLSTLAIVVQAVGWATGTTTLTLATNLPGLSVDILLILALSSERALTYARRTRKVPKRISGRPGDSAAI